MIVAPNVPIAARSAPLIPAPLPALCAVSALIFFRLEALTLMEIPPQATRVSLFPSFSLPAALHSARAAAAVWSLELFARLPLRRAVMGQDVVITRASDGTSASLADHARALRDPPSGTFASSPSPREAESGEQAEAGAQPISEAALAMGDRRPAPSTGPTAEPAEGSASALMARFRATFGRSRSRSPRGPQSPQSVAYSQKP